MVMANLAQRFDLENVLSLRGHFPIGEQFFPANLHPRFDKLQFARRHCVSVLPA